MVALCALLAYALLGVALVLFRETVTDLATVGLVLASLGLALGGSCVPASPRVESEARRSVPRMLAWLVAAEIVTLLTGPVGIYLRMGTLQLWFRLGVLLLGVLALNYGRKKFLPAAWVFPAILAVHFLVGAWMLWNTRVPYIDVWHFQQLASKHLLAGENPYAEDYPNIYPDGDLYGPGVLKNNRIQSFPYPPLSLLLVLPGYGLGDVRWVLLLAQGGTAALLVARGRRLGLPAGHPAELAAVALLCHPRTFYVMEQAWTEPLLALAVGACAWFLPTPLTRGSPPGATGGEEIKDNPLPPQGEGRGATRQRVGFALALTALFSVKQYGILWLPSLWATRCLRWRELLAALAGSALLALPFLLWDFPGFWQGVVVFQFRQPFRKDALSVPAVVYSLTGWQMSPLVGFLAAAAVGALLLRRAVPTLAHAALGGAALFLAFFVFNKQAFTNYYWFVGVLLCTAVSVSFTPNQPGERKPI